MEAKPINLRMINLECCYTCQACFADGDGWFCVLDKGPRWTEFDMPFRHICDRFVSRELFHPMPNDPPEDQRLRAVGAETLPGLE